MLTQNSQNSQPNLYCKKCDYYANRKSDYKKHLQSKKHNTYAAEKNTYACFCGKEYKQRQSLYNHKIKCIYVKNQDHNEKWIKMDKKWINLDKFEKCPFLCECGKKYKFHSGLSKHKKICQTNKILDTEKDDLKEMVMKLLEQNERFAKEPKIINNTTTNNTQFNVMNYLNTECKDAMNLTDFINSFEFSIKDLEMLNNKGYQEAMEHTFVKQLCDMDKTKRPIHCSDKKRKSFYIKEDDIWEKDTNNEKIIKGMKKLSFIHSNTLNKWKNKNQDWNNNERKQVFYCNSIIEFTKCDKEKERNKVLSKLVNLSIK